MSKVWSMDNTFGWNGGIRRAVIWRCSVNKACGNKNCGKFAGKCLCGSLFLMKFQALRPATLLKSNFSKYAFTWILQSFKTPIWEQLLLNRLGVRRIFSFLNAIWKRRSSTKMTITHECFKELVVLVNNDFTK